MVKEERIFVYHQMFHKIISPTTVYTFYYLKQFIFLISREDVVSFIPLNVLLLVRMIYVIRHKQICRVRGAKKT